jgi:diguanylate cyclase (GGDEF)-like protein
MRKVMLDSLTQLKTRVSLLRDVSSMHIGHLVLLDIDNFHSINTTYGVQEGDIVLVKLADFLKDFAQKKGYKLYRIASNEFALLDYDAKLDMDDVHNDIQYLIDMITQHDIYIDAIQDHINIHVTIGFALSSGLILEQASAALKYAKKNFLKFSAYSNLTNDTVTPAHYAYWNKEIQKAINRDNIIPFFQPIYNLAGHIVKHEVLMRLVLEGADKKLFISPDEFLNISIQTKWYADLSRTIIFNALDILKNSNHKFSINLAYQDLQNKELIRDIYSFLETNPHVAKRVTFEILESELIKDTTILVAFLKKIKHYGVEIAIDDFGSGFSNFEMILLIEPEFIKIDGSLIKNVDVDAKALTLVEAIVMFSHKMGIKVVAEYVHSKEVYDILKTIDVDLFQGFYLSEPLFTPN